MKFYVQVMTVQGWRTHGFSYDLEEAYDMADELQRRRLMLDGIRVYEPFWRATYYMPERKKIKMHGLTF